MNDNRKAFYCVYGLPSSELIGHITDIDLLALPHNRIAFTVELERPTFAARLFRRHAPILYTFTGWVWPDRWENHLALHVLDRDQHLMDHVHGFERWDTSAALGWQARRPPVETA